ncbi:MAG: ATP-binding cassette domain-containing protein, partial [Chloroflexota bacterium]
DRLTREAQLRELQQREFKKLKASSEQLTQWARQNPKFAPRAENMRRKLEEERQRLESTPPPVLHRPTIDVQFTTERGSTLVLEASGVGVRFGDREVLQPFDLVIRHGERVGIVGANGSGKTTLVRAALGTIEPTEGRVRLGPSVVVGYYAQEQETLNPASTAMDMIRKIKPMTEQEAIGFLNSLLFTRDDMLNSIGNLSGGEKSRLQIAVLIAQGANFLVLDEPTNNLDIGSIEQLEAALDALLVSGQGTLLTISHDRAFLESMCTRIIEVDNGWVRDYPGGWAYLDRHRGEGTLLTRQEPPTSQPPAKKKLR